MQLLKRLVTLALPFTLYLEDLVRVLKGEKWKESQLLWGIGRSDETQR